MSQQEKVYEKYRRAKDEAGDTAWAVRLSKRAIWVPGEQMAQEVLAQLELKQEEKVTVGLLGLPRNYTDVESCGVMAQAEMRCFLRALHAVEVLETQDPSMAKALVPLEIRRAKERLSGKLESKSKGKGKRTKTKLRGQVYRPPVAGIGGTEDEPEAQPTASAAAPQPSATFAAQSGTASAEDLAFERMIRMAAKAHKGADHFKVMGLPRDANSEAVKKAYLELAKRFHPDRLAGHAFEDPAKVQSTIEKVFARISDAYRVLQDEGLRRDYLEQLESGDVVSEGAGGKVRRPEEASLQHKKGLVFLHKKDYSQARKMFVIASELDSGNAIHPTFTAWVTFLDESRDKTEREIEATTTLERIMRESPNAQAAYFLGTIFKLRGDETKAYSRFRRALEMDASHADARREVRLFNLRQKKGPQTQGDQKGAGGLLDRLMKR